MGLHREKKKKKEAEKKKKQSKKKKNVKNENRLAIEVTHIKQGTSYTKRKWLSTTKESSCIKEHTKK